LRRLVSPPNFFTDHHFVGCRPPFVSLPFARTTTTTTTTTLRQSRLSRTRNFRGRTTVKRARSRRSINQSRACVVVAASSIVPSFPRRRFVRWPRCPRRCYRGRLGSQRPTLRYQVCSRNSSDGVGPTRDYDHTRHGWVNRVLYRSSDVSRSSSPTPRGRHLDTVVPRTWTMF